MDEWIDILRGLRAGPVRDAEGPEWEVVSEGIRLILEARSRGHAAEVIETVRSLFAELAGVDVGYLFTRTTEGGEIATEDENLIRYVLLHIPDIDPFFVEEGGRNIFDLAYALRNDQNLISSEPDLPFRMVDTVSTMISRIFPKRGSVKRGPHQLKLDDHAWSLRYMKVPEAWADSQTMGAGLEIGHPDTGYADHDDFDGDRILKNRGDNYVEKGQPPKDPLNWWTGLFGGLFGSPGHGTKTGSVIMSGGGVSSPDVGCGTTGLPRRNPVRSKFVTGVAPEAELIPIRVANRVWAIYGSNIARGIEYANNQSCPVISLSMGSFPLKVLEDAVDEVCNGQRLLVCAAGNEVRTVVFPARYPNTVSVAAATIDGKPWWRSSRGKAVTISAPGVNVWHANPMKGRLEVEAGSGTSYATANCAGVAALWLAKFNHQGLANQATAANVKLVNVFQSELRRTCQQFPSDGHRQKFGLGIIDAQALLRSPPDLQLYADQAGSPANSYMQIAVDMVEDRFLDMDGLRLWSEVLDSQLEGLKDIFEAFGQELVILMMFEAIGQTDEAFDPLKMPSHVRDLIDAHGSLGLRVAIGLTD